MPNWCACTISIKGSEEDMKVFYPTLDKPNESGDKVDFSFHQTVPSANDGKKFFTGPGELPNTGNWGTKWDACEVKILKKEPTEFFIHCETAWSPPLDWGHKFANKFRSLTVIIAYCEQGMQFYGVWTGCGKDRKTITEEYKFMDDDMLSYRTEEQIDATGNKVEVRIRDDDDPDDFAPNGRLKEFMEKYSLEHTGG